MITVNFKSYQAEDDSDEWSYIHVADPDHDIKNQVDPDEIVINMNKIYVRYTYPLTNHVILEFTADNGFTRAELAKKVCAGYKQIYDEEEISGKPGYIRPGCLNRATSHGPYGIWGHVIDDLVLYEVVQIQDNLFELGVDS